MLNTLIDIVVGNISFCNNSTEQKNTANKQTSTNNNMN